jgi:hypothetical protein
LLMVFYLLEQPNARWYSRTKVSEMKPRYRDGD